MKNEKPESADQEKNSQWFRTPFAKELLTLQHKLTNELSGLLRTIQKEKNPASVAAMVLLAFIYGIIHSLGPGHAKVLFASHAASQPTSLRSTWKAGAIFSITHIGSAILLFAVMRLILGISHTQSDVYSSRLLSLSGVLIIVAGMIVIFSSLIEESLQSMAKRFLGRLSSINSIAIIAGLAPCPGAFLVLVFSSMIGILHIGILAAAAISVGMALTVSIAGSLGSFISFSLHRKKADTFMRFFQQGIRYAGGVVIVLVGILTALQ